MNTLLALVRARNQEFIRDRATFVWYLLFPFLMIFGLALIFSGDGPPLAKVGLLQATPAAREASAAVPSWVPDALRDPAIQLIPLTADTDAQRLAEAKVRQHQLDLLLSPMAYWVNQTNPKGRMLSRLLTGNASAHPTKQDAALSSRWQANSLSGDAMRYVDWLFPGALAVNMLLSCFFGTGYVVVRYRKAQILRRLKVTPITRSQFLAAQMISRWWLVMLINVVLFVGCDLLLDFAYQGGLGLLFLVLSLGAWCLISFSLALCARLTSEELADNLLDFITWPMMLLSEVWFSIEGAHPLLRRLAEFFPLTHIVRAARAVMLEGATWSQIAPQLALLTLLGCFFTMVAIALFRWE